MARIFDRLQAVLRGEAPEMPIGQFLGIRLTELEPGRTVVEFTAGPQHANPMGTLHGGVLCDVADAAMGMAYGASLNDEESFTTLELKINYLRPFWSGKLRAEANVLRRGRTIGW